MTPSVCVLQHDTHFHGKRRKGDMITVWGEGRGFRVIWLLEEMKLPYRLRSVDLLAGVEKDPEFLAVNPGGFIPVLQDSDVVMVESVAIMEYLVERYGPTPLAPSPLHPAFPLYKQFLHLGEAGLAGTMFFAAVARNFGPESDRKSWTAHLAMRMFESRMKLVTRQLARSRYLAGDTFTAADISVGYALLFSQKFGKFALGDIEQTYLARLMERDGWKRALESCPATKKAWAL
jgi:glutathione S-transferase